MSPVQLSGQTEETHAATGESTDFVSDEYSSQINAARVAANAKRCKIPATLLKDILCNLEKWQAQKNQRYKQQLKMQRVKLKMPKRIAESAN